MARFIFKPILFFPRRKYKVLAMPTVFALDYTQPYKGVLQRDADVFFEDFHRRCGLLSPRQLRDWLLGDVMVFVLALLTTSSLTRTLIHQPLGCRVSRGYASLMVDRLLKQKPADAVVRDLFAMHPLAMRLFSDTLFESMVEGYDALCDQLLYLQWGLPIRFYWTFIRTYTLTPLESGGHVLSFDVPVLYQNRHPSPFRLRLGSPRRKANLVSIPASSGAAIRHLESWLCRDVLALCLQYVPF